MPNSRRCEYLERLVTAGRQRLQQREELGLLGLEGGDGNLRDRLIRARLRTVACAHTKAFNLQPASVASHSRAGGTPTYVRACWVTCALVCSSESPTVSTTRALWLVANFATCSTSLGSVAEKSRVCLVHLLRCSAESCDR